MFDFLLQVDKNLLIQARSIISDDSTLWIVILGELIVFWYALFIICLWMYGVIKKNLDIKKQALNIAILIILVFGIYSILNFGIPQWRESPQDVIGSVQALIPHPIDNSFPSGHALFWGAGLVAICTFIKDWRIITLSLLIGLVSNIARVLGAIHYPGDTIFGFIIGIIGGILFLSLSKKITHSIFPLFNKLASFFRL